MIVIDELCISLPSGYETRARSIARFVGDELSKHVLSGSASEHPYLSPPEILISPDQSDVSIGQAIATGIINALKKNGGAYASL